MTSAGPARRADAIRNRGALLAAAEEVFAESGLDTSVSDIAARAGVGKGTFFRHFASKDDLIAAIAGLHVDELSTFGEQLLSETDAGNALLAFVTEAAGRRRQRDVEFLLRASESDPVLTGMLERFSASVDALLARAQASGDIRRDISAHDVIRLMCAPAHVVDAIHDPHPDLWKRYLALIFDGLRPAGAHPLPA